MTPDDSEIQKLLRLKRFEQPAPQYFDTFLRDFQRRQRSEMLRQPLWRIVMDRTQAFFGEHSVGRHTHAFAMAGVLLLGGLATLNMTLPPSGTQTTVVAQNDAQPPMRLNLTPPGPELQPVAQRAWLSGAQLSAPRHYVMDTRPVSYERPSSF